MMSHSHRTMTKAVRLAVILLIASLAPLNAQRTAFYDDFTNGNSKGWTIGSEWQIGAATASGPWIYMAVGDPDHDADGVLHGGVAGVVLGGLCSNTIHPAYNLDSPPIYIRPGDTATLQFKRWLVTDYPAYIQHSVAVFDGTTWVTIWTTAGAGAVTILDTAWQSISLDVSAYANPGFRVRFSMSVVSNSAFASPSWNLDNVRVAVDANDHLCFADDFASGNSRGWTLGPLWQIGNAVPYAASNNGFTGDPATDGDGTPGGGLAGVVIGGATNPNTPQALSSLQSPIITLTPGVQTILTFRRRLQSDYPPFMNSILSVFDGTNWQTLFSITTTTTFVDQAWQTVSYDVTAYANANFRFRFSYFFTGTSFASPSWSIDNVRLVQNPKQPNSPAARLDVNGVGGFEHSGFAETLTNTSGLNLSWHGTPNMPFVLIGSVNEGPHTDLSGLGMMDIGTAPSFSDVFVIFDGLSYPGVFYATLDSTGTNNMSLSAAGIPLGTQFYIQGLVAQFSTGSPAPFTFTAAHFLTKS